MNPFKAIIVALLTALAIHLVFEAGRSTERREVKQRVYKYFGEGDEGELIAYYLKTGKIDTTKEDITIDGQYKYKFHRDTTMPVDARFWYSKEPNSDTTYELIAYPKDKWSLRHIPVAEGREYQVDVDTAGTYVYDHGRYVGYVPYSPTSKFDELITLDNQ